MRTVRAKKALRRRWARHPAATGLVAEADVTFHPRSRLRVKLLVFRSRQSLRRFWREAFESSIGGDTSGVCHVLGQTIVEIRPGRPERTRREVDPRYVCAIGLVLGWLNFEIISHESMHAGFAVSRRVRRRLWPLEGEEIDEEEVVCYPAGRIAAAINRFLHLKQLYAPEQVEPEPKKSPARRRRIRKRARG